MAGPGNLLCVANFPSNTGYAWEFIESLYAGLADDLHRFGVRTWVAYPRVDEPPSTLADSAAEPLELPVDYASIPGLAALVRRSAPVTSVPSTSPTAPPGTRATPS